MKKIREKLTTPWVKALLSLVSLIIGLFAGKFLEVIVPPLFQPSNFPYIAYFLISFLFLIDVIYSITLWSSTQQHVADINEYTQDLAAGLGHRVKTIAYSQGYDELIKRIERAESEILILTEYVNIFDWENCKPIWDAERINSPERKQFYDTLQKKVTSEREDRNPFTFVKIVQIPEGHKLAEMLAHDDLYRKNCEFMLDIAKEEPEFARIKVTKMMFNNSVILIDKSFAHISFDVKGHDDSSVEAPFVMLIEDPKSDALMNLLKLYKRIEQRSTLLTRADLEKS